MGPTDGNILDQRTNWELETGAGTWRRVFKLEALAAGGRAWPQAGDYAEFWGAYNHDCIVNTYTSLSGIRTYSPGTPSSGNFTATISMQDDLELTGTSDLQSGLTITGHAGRRGTINLAGDLCIYSGTFSNVSVEVASMGYLQVGAPPASAPNPSMVSTGFDINGTLYWASGDVSTSRLPGIAESVIHVRAGGKFRIRGDGYTWGTSAEDLLVTNRGIVHLDSTGQATIIGNYLTHGTTRLERGVLRVNGSIRQTEPQASFELIYNTTIIARGAGHLMRIEGGWLVGNGTVAGNLNIGRDPAVGGGPSAATIAPGSGYSVGSGVGASFGTITVQENFEMFGASTMEIDAEGAGAAQHDWVVVAGYAKLSGTIVGNIKVPPRAPDWIKFLTADHFPSDFTGQAITPGWTRLQEPQVYWFVPHTRTVGGHVRRDENGNGIYESGPSEVPLAGIVVYLFDEAGNQLGEPVTTDALGYYDFGPVLYGSYEVRMARPPELRPVRVNAGTDESLDNDCAYDADLDVVIAAVTLSEEAPHVTNTADALFRPLTAADDAYHVLDGHTLTGNVLDNDPPADGDTLTVTLYSAPPVLGTLTLNADGTFVYLAPEFAEPGPTVAVTFTYLVTDRFGHTATGVVTIYVHPQWTTGNGDPPPPPP